MKKYLATRAIVLAAVKQNGGTSNTPAANTKNLNGVGGGSSAAINIPTNPFCSTQCRMACACSPALLWNNASPPFRAIKYSNTQPSTDPSAAKNAYSGIRAGR